MEIDCDKDIKTFVDKSEQLTSLKQLQLNGDAKPSDWEQLFEKIKIKTKIKTVVFNENTFTVLPYKYEGLFNIENLTFSNAEELDYSLLIEQLANLPNIRELNLEVVTIFELPTKIEQLKNLELLRIVNTDESISKNDTSLSSSKNEPITYDYSIKKENGNTVAIKYTAMAGEIDSDEYKELAKRFTTTNNFVGTTTFVPKYENVKPPIKGIDVERANYTINPQIENIVTYPSGTKILIPANAFTDKNGNPVTSSVSLSYREFRDPVDFLVSGIPMKYDTAGEVNNFESAGMFELLASSKNEPLIVAQDKSIDMNFVTTSIDSSYNFYAFDDNKGNWDYLSRPKTVTSETKIQLKEPTKAFRIFSAYSFRTHVYDSTKFENRFESNMYTYTNIKGKGGKKIPYRYNGRKRSKPANSLVRINRIRKSKEGDVLFKVSYLSNSHPEMCEFNNVYFALNENMSLNEFKQKYGKRKYYNDVRVTTNGGDLEIKLKDDKSVKNLAVSIVTINEKGVTKEIKNKNAKVRGYNRRLNSRERKFNRTLARGKIKNNLIKVTDRRQMNLYAFNQAKKSMTEDEKKMSFDEWVDYCKETEKNITAWNNQVNAEKLNQLSNQRANESNLVQSFSLRGMGIFNCDQIQRIEERVELLAKYKTEENEKLNPHSVYLIDKKGNSVFQYDGSYGYSPSKISFSKSKKAENTLIAINKDGSIGIYSNEQFADAEFKNKSRFEFVVTKIEPKFTTVGDLKTLMGF